MRVVVVVLFVTAIFAAGGGVAYLVMRPNAKAASIEPLKTTDFKLAYARLVADTNEDFATWTRSMPERITEMSPEFRLESKQNLTTAQKVPDNEFEDWCSKHGFSLINTPVNKWAFRRQKVLYLRETTTENILHWGWDHVAKDSDKGSDLLGLWCGNFLYFSSHDLRDAPDQVREGSPQQRTRYRNQFREEFLAKLQGKAKPTEDDQRLFGELFGIGAALPSGW